MEKDSEKTRDATIRRICSMVKDARTKKEKVKQRIYNLHLKGNITFGEFSSLETLVAEGRLAEDTIKAVFENK